MIFSTDAQEYLDLLRFETQFLEHIFGKKWFQKSRPGHPAYVRWQLLTTYIHKDGMIDGPADIVEMTALGRASLDAHLLLALAGGNLAMRDPGDLTAYGDETMQQFLTARLPRVEFFEDVMCELTYAGWHRSNGHAVTPDQTDAMPDLRIDLPPSILADCKRPTTNNLNSLKNHLKKANKQVEAYNHQHNTNLPGLAILDISSIVQAGLVQDDEIPSIVKTYEENLKRLLHGPYSSLSAVIILWDDLRIQECEAKTWYGFRRRGRQINHQIPRQPLPEARLFEQIEVRHSVLWWKPLKQPLEIRSSVAFDPLVIQLGIDPLLAADTYLHPDNVQTLFFNDTTHRRFTLALKHFPHATVPHTLLVGADEIHGTSDTPSQAVLQFALPSRADENTTKIPRQFLIHILEQYGHEFAFRGRNMILVTGVAVPGPPDKIGNELRNALPGKNTWFYAGAAGDAGHPDALVRVALAFHLDLDRYRRWRSAAGEPAPSTT